MELTKAQQPLTTVIVFDKGIKNPRVFLHIQEEKDQYVAMCVDEDKKKMEVAGERIAVMW